MANADPTPSRQEGCRPRRRQRENWGTKIGVIFAVAGSAVGLGNFLRFPGEAALHGGGAFMIPYFVSLLLLGIPICWAEWTMGRYGGTRGHNSAPGIFGMLWRHPAGKYCGALAVMIPVVVYMYYVYIEAWCLKYAYDYATGSIMEVEDYSKHFGEFVGIQSNRLPGGWTLLILLAVFVMNFFLIFRGITKGIEMFAKVAMPLLIVIALFMLIRVLTLGTPNPEKPENNINNALGFMWNPKVMLHYQWEQSPGHHQLELEHDKSPQLSFQAPQVDEPALLEFSGKVYGGLKERSQGFKVSILPGGEAKPETLNLASTIAHSGETVELRIDEQLVADVRDQPFWAALADGGLWLAAAAQIFFSLSVGFGIIINYSSYLRRKDDVVLSGLTATATNEFCEVCLAGLIIIPVAFLFLGPAMLTGDVLGSSLSLGFHALPAVFQSMPAGRLFGFLFFLLLFVAAITSSLSMLQPAIAFLEEGFSLGRRASVAVLAFIVTCGALIVIFFSKNLLALDTMDFWIGTVAIYVMAMIMTVTFGWIFGTERAKREIVQGADMRVPRVFWFVIKYVSPLYLLVVFVAWLWNSLPQKLTAIAEMAPEDRHVVLLVLLFLAALLCLLLVLVKVAGARWETHRPELIPDEEVIP